MSGADEVDPLRTQLAEIARLRVVQNLAYRAYKAAAAETAQAEHEFNGMIEPLKGPPIDPPTNVGGAR